MKIHLVLIALGLAACSTSPAPVGDESPALTLRQQIDSAAGALILGASPDNRSIFYGAPCDASAANGATLRVLDDWTGVVTTLATGVECRPGSMLFSPDGRLASFGSGDGVAQVYDAATGRVVTVSRAGQSTIGVVFSPDSSWLVVATAGDPPSLAALDAWDADLVHHTEIATGVSFNPFGAGADNFRFSPDATQLLYVGDATGPIPLGTLTRWDRATGASHAIATGVLSNGYVVSADFSRVALLAGVVIAGPPPFQGDLKLVDLRTGAVEALESAVAALPLAFTPTGDTLLYLAGTPATLKAHAVGTTRTAFLDSNVFSSFGPGGSVALDPSGSRVAYLTGFDPQRFAGELHLASLPDAAGHVAPPRVISTSALPGAFGWTGAGALAYLHDATASFPGAATASLAAFRPSLGTSKEIAAGVTQLGLRFDPTEDRLLYLSAYDAELAAGDLHAWSPYSGKSRLLGHRAAVMSVKPDPAFERIGFLELTRGADPSVPPTTRLELARVYGASSATRVDSAVTSLAVGDYGRVVYTTSAGLIGAWVF